MQMSNYRLLGRLATVGLFAWACMAAAQPNPNLPANLQPYFDAIRNVESRGHPWSIYNNTISKSYKLNSRAEAETKAKELLALGHNLDVGIMQLNWKYQSKRPGVNLANIFDPSINEGIARQVFLEFWQQAQALAGDFNNRIMAAVGAYNNGRIRLPNPGYVRKVWQAMGNATTHLIQELTSNTAGPANRASQLDESLGRAVSKKDRKLTPDEAKGEAQAQNGEDQAAQNQDSSGSSGWLALLVGGGLLALGILGGTLLIKAVGLLKVVRIASMASSATKSRAKNL